VALSFKLSGRITIGGHAYDVHFADTQPFAYIKQAHDRRHELARLLVGDPKKTVIRHTSDGDGLVHEYSLALIAHGAKWTHTIDPAIINRVHM
jgi:hypothetical protein